MLGGIILRARSCRLPYSERERESTRAREREREREKDAHTQRDRAMRVHLVQQQAVHQVRSACDKDAPVLLGFSLFVLLPLYCLLEQLRVVFDLNKKAHPVAGVVSGTFAS